MEKVKIMNEKTQSIYKTNDTLKKNKRKRKNRKKFIARLFLFLVFIGCLIAIAISPICNTKSIYITGKTRYTQEKLFNSSGIIIGINSFKNIGGDLFAILQLRDKKAEENIMETYPYVKTAKVIYRLPSKFEIAIEERIPYIYIKYRNQFVIADTEGIALENMNQRNNLNIPTFTAVLNDGFTLGKVLNFEHEDTFENVKYILNKIKISDTNSSYKIYNKIYEIKSNSDGNIILNLGNKIDANIGFGENINYKIDFLRTIYQSILKTGEKGYLDFTLEEKPVLQPTRK
jgi:cell division protein FtsQ